MKTSNPSPLGVVMRFFTLFACACLFVIACVGHTNAFGGWISGGGKIKLDADNPWFLFNTKQVYWCVDLDQNNFSAPLDQSISTIEKGLTYWKRELSNAKGALPDGFIEQQIGTQNFTYQQCDGREDLKFLLGRVTPELIDFLAKQGETPSNYVGLAVRTSYDVVNLKAKGFIYISPDIKGSRHLPRNKRFKENVWSQEKSAFLQAVINHEIGHIFGIQHQEPESFSSINNIDLMSERFPETASTGSIYILDKLFPRIFNWDEFMTHTTGKTCAIDEKFRKVFDIPSDIVCIELAIIDNDVEIKEVSNSNDKRQLAYLSLFRTHGQGRSNLNLWLPYGQRVIKDDNNIYTEGPIGIAPYTGTNHTFYTAKLLNGSTLESYVKIESEPGCSKISVVSSLSSPKLITQVLEKNQHPEVGSRPCEIH